MSEEIAFSNPPSFPLSKGGITKRDSLETPLF